MQTNYGRISLKNAFSRPLGEKMQGPSAGGRLCGQALFKEKLWKPEVLEKPCV
jgi:hypothetical protein